MTIATVIIARTAAVTRSFNGSMTQSS